MAKSVTETALDRVRAKIAPLEATLAGLRIAEAALLDAIEPVPSESKAKRTRGPNKAKGLPTTFSTGNTSGVVGVQASNG